MVEQADGFAMHEQKSKPTFLEKPLSGHEAARCVDGRPAGDKEHDEQGPQLLGGSMLPLLLRAIDTNTPFTADTVTQGIPDLQEKGFTPGVHRDHHAHGQSCGCGFCDQMKHIYTTALNNREVFTAKLKTVYAGYPDILGSPDAIDKTYQKFNQYTPENIQLTGEPLVAHAEEKGATCEIVTGDHAEEAAFVNAIPGVTLDTQKLNEQGRQAFNLDILAAVEQAKALGVSEDFAKAASLILYLATEKVLVEDKGKPPLPVVIHG